MKLIVIDMQEGLLDEELYNFEILKNNIKSLIKTARKNNVEVIFIRHDGGPDSGFTDGDEFFEFGKGFEPLENEKQYVKTINTAFSNKEFKDYIEGCDDKELMIVGLQTDFCIDATIKSAKERGFNVFVPNKTNSAYGTEYMDAETTYRYFNEWVWPGAFATCISMAKAIRMLENKE